MEESKDAFCHSRREKTAISLQQTDKEEVTPAAEVSVTTSTAVKKRLTSERTMEQMEYFMEHIMQRHVQPLQYRGKSFFLSTNKQYIPVRKF